MSHPEEPPPAPVPGTTSPAGPPTPPVLDEPAPLSPGGREPSWRWWYAVLGVVVAIGLILTVVAPIAFVTRFAAGVEPGENLPALTIFEAILSDLALAVAAVAVAAIGARPRARHFGFRPTRFWPAVGFSVLAVAAYLTFAALYELVYPEDVEQNTLESLGAGRGTAALIAVGVLVVVIAPLVEEFFFRGFLYRTLRNSLSIPAAALIVGGFFGSIHASTGVAATLPLAVLGVAFCLVVERTGSLYPVIALHSIVNGLAYSVSPQAPDGSAFVAVPLLALMLSACVLLPALAGRKPPVTSAPARVAY